MIPADLTPTQRKLAEILSDGLAHSREELMVAIDDELSGLQNLRQHLHNLRKKLLLRGETIIAEQIQFKYYWRWVRLLPNAYNGKR